MRIVWNPKFGNPKIISLDRDIQYNVRQRGFFVINDCLLGLWVITLFEQIKRTIFCNFERTWHGYVAIKCGGINFYLCRQAIFTRKESEMTNETRVQIDIITLKKPWAKAFWRPIASKPHKIPVRVAGTVNWLNGPSRPLRVPVMNGA